MAVTTVVERVYYQEKDSNPFAVEDVYEMENKQEEQPYQRTIVVGPEPQRIDCGWVKNPGLVYIKNRGEEEEQRIKVRIYPFHKIAEGFWVPPRASSRFYPTHPKQLGLSAEQETKVTVTVFPE